MKVAVLSESPADEAAVFVLVQGLLGLEIERVALPTPKTRGWQAVLKSVRPALILLHYQTDADALLVTLDSDESPVHQRGHDEPGGADPLCRLCRLRGIVAAAQAELRPRQGRGPIKTALGVAVPAVEAWCLAGLDPHITEAAWIQAMQCRSLPYTKNDLKRRMYGTDRPSLLLAEECAIKQARRLVEAGQLPYLEQLFPAGFGALASEVRGW